MYIWKKYTIGSSNEYVTSSGSPSVVESQSDWSGLGSYTGYSSYNLDSSTGEFSLSGSTTNLQNSSYLYTGGGSSVVEYNRSENQSPADTYEVTATTLTATLQQVQDVGSYLEDVMSETRLAYPDNGIQGGYWYVYQGVLSPLPAPASISYSNPVSGQVMTVSWSGVSGATSYRLEKSVGGGAWTGVASPAGISYSYTVAEAAGVTIALRACGYNGINGSYVTGSTLTVAAPTNSDVRSGGTWQGSKAWQKVSGTWRAVQPWVKKNGTWVKST